MGRLFSCMRWNTIFLKRQLFSFTFKETYFLVCLTTKICIDRNHVMRGFLNKNAITLHIFYSLNFFHLVVHYDHLLLWQRIIICWSKTWFYRLYSMSWYDSTTVFLIFTYRWPFILHITFLKLAFKEIFLPPPAHTHIENPLDFPYSPDDSLSSW